MTAGAAVFAIIAALAVGWFAAYFWIAEHDELSAKARHDNAVKTMWRYRRALGVVVVVVLVLGDLWFKGKGR